MPQQVTAWKCDHCGMTSLYKANVKRHENSSCPNFRSCKLCKFYHEQEDTVYDGYHMGEPVDHEELFMWCCRNCDDGHDNCIELTDRFCNCQHFKEPTK